MATPAAAPPSPLRELRLSQHLTQRELARRAGVCRATIASIEAGEPRRRYPATLHVLAEALGVDVADIKPRNGAAP